MITSLISQFILKAFESKFSAKIQVPWYSTNGIGQVHQDGL